MLVEALGFLFLAVENGVPGTGVFAGGEAALIAALTTGFVD